MSASCRMGRGARDAGPVPARPGSPGRRRGAALAACASAAAVALAAPVRAAEEPQARWAESAEVLTFRWAERDVDRGKPSDYVILNTLVCQGAACDLVAMRFNPCIGGAFGVYPTVLSSARGEIAVRLVSAEELRVEQVGAGTALSYRLHFRRADRALAQATLLGVTGTKNVLGHPIEVQPVAGDPGTTTTSVDLQCSRLAVPTLRGPAAR